MITEQDLRAAIAECEGIRNPNANTCVKLAAFYTILDKLNRTDKPMISYSYDAGPENIPYSNSEFSKIVESVGMPKVFPVLDDLMEMLYVTNRPLYESVIAKIEF